MVHVPGGTITAPGAQFDGCGGSDWFRPRPSGHTTPSFFMRNRSVLGWMPSRSAALPTPLIRQPQRSQDSLDVGALDGVEIVSDFGAARGWQG